MEKAPSCPRRHSPHVVPILYGKPDHAGITLAQHIEVMLGGCVCSGNDDPIWFCHECQSTIHADSAHYEWYDHEMPMRS
jgi:hypothetical protein